MKFVAACLAVLGISLVLCVGMWLASHGRGLWPLLVGIVGFLGMFVRYGCRTH